MCLIHNIFFYSSLIKKTPYQRLTSRDLLKAMTEADGKLRKWIVKNKCVLITSSVVCFVFLWVTSAVIFLIIYNKPQRYETPIQEAKQITTTPPPREKIASHPLSLSWMIAMLCLFLIFLGYLLKTYYNLRPDGDLSKVDLKALQMLTMEHKKSKEKPSALENIKIKRDTINSASETMNNTLNDSYDNLVFKS